MIVVMPNGRPKGRSAQGNIYAEPRPLRRSNNLLNDVIPALSRVIRSKLTRTRALAGLSWRWPIFELRLAISTRSAGLEVLISTNTRPPEQLLPIPGRETTNKALVAVLWQ